MQQAPKKSSCGCGMKQHSHNASHLSSSPKPIKHGGGNFVGCGGTELGCCPYKTNQKCGVARLNKNGTNCTANKKCVTSSFCGCPNTNPNGTYKLLYGKCPNANFAKANPQGSNCPGYKPPCSALNKKLGAC